MFLLAVDVDQNNDSFSNLCCATVHYFYVWYHDADLKFAMVVRWVYPTVIILLTGATLLSS